jgi:hypothetical protein
MTMAGKLAPDLRADLRDINPHRLIAALEQRLCCAAATLFRAGAAWRRRN